MKKVKFALFVVVILVITGYMVNALAFPFFGRTEPPVINDPGNTGENPGEDPTPDPDPDPDPDPVPNDRIPRPEHVRGLYLSGNGAGAPSLRDPVLQILRETELNALVIDVKRDDGHVTYRDTNVQLAIEAKANVNFVNMRAFLETLREEQVYPIARIVVAKDKFISKIKPEWFLQDKNGGLWKGAGDTPWADLRNQDYWDYLIDLGIEAAEMGFREIQFDYVRWPSGGDGSVSRVANFPPANMTREGTYERTEIIASFLAYAKDKLAPYDVEVSADTFGIMGSVRDEQSIGQQLEVILSSEIDLISPMIYPGHYAKGTYGLPNPNRAPYETVLNSTRDHLERIEAAGSNMLVRPWLQDFNDWFDKDYSYKVPQIHDQLRALDELGVKEYLFWNARNVYTWEAYRTWEWSQ